MKLLHIFEYGLADWRIEKSAITAKRKGYDVYFLGAQKKIDYSNVIIFLNDFKYIKFKEFNV